jgi:hypothetical protein
MSLKTHRVLYKVESYANVVERENAEARTIVKKEGRGQYQGIDAESSKKETLIGEYLT